MRMSLLGQIFYSSRFAFWQDKCVRGPISAFLQHTEAMGWHFANYYTIHIPGLDDAVDIRDVHASQLELWFAQHMRIEGLREELSAHYPAGDVDAVCATQPWGQLFRRAIRRLTSTQRRALTDAIGGVTLTNMKLAALGLIGSPKCVCGACVDTVHHRIYECPLSQHVRDEFSEGLISFLRSHPGMLAERAIVPTPAPKISPAAVGKLLITHQV